MYFGPDFYDYEYFNKRVYRFNADWNGWIKIIQSLEQLFDLTRTIDVGCGTGSFTKYCLKMGYYCIGFDFSRYAIFNGLADNLLLADARLIPFKDNSFTFTFVSDLLEHIYDEDIDMVLDEIFRISCKTIFFQVACTGMPDKPDHEIVLKKNMMPRKEWLKYVVREGHVNIRHPSYWIKKFSKYKEYRRNIYKEIMFRQLTPQPYIQNWYHIYVYEKVE